MEVAQWSLVQIDCSLHHKNVFYSMTHYAGGGEMDLACMGDTSYNYSLSCDDIKYST